MKRIKLLTMGGTISAHHDSRVDYRNYVSGRYPGEAMLAAVPELAGVARVEAEAFTNVSSMMIDSGHWLALREKLRRTLGEDGFDGVVITHGTNTLEETAYFLHLCMPTDKPIVLTGAQRPFSSLGSDAFTNVLASVRVAASEAAVGKGVLVVLNDRIHSARDVSKTNTYRLDTFHSGELGALGVADPDEQVVFYRAPTRRHTVHSAFSALDLQRLPEVEIVYSYAGARGNLIRALLAAGQTEGIVMAGTGAGKCSGDEEAALAEASAAGVQVVMGTRVAEGRVVPLDAYAYLNAVTSDNLPPHKARILLMLGLLRSREPGELQGFMDSH